MIHFTFSVCLPIGHCIFDTFICCFTILYCYFNVITRDKRSKTHKQQQECLQTPEKWKAIFSTCRIRIALSQHSSADVPAKWSTTQYNDSLSHPAAAHDTWRNRWLKSDSFCLDLPGGVSMLLGLGLKINIKRFKVIWQARQQPFLYLHIQQIQSFNWGFVSAHLLNWSPIFSLGFVLASTISWRKNQV